MKYCSLFVLGSGLFIVNAQKTERPAIFTAAQAEAGRLAVEETCGKCHTPSLLGRRGDGSELPSIGSLSEAYQTFIGPRKWVPPLAGPAFLRSWGSKTAAQLIARFQETVPAFPPTGMNDETTVNITAYVLQLNGARPGSEPLTRTTSTVINSLTHWP